MKFTFRFLILATLMLVMLLSLYLLRYTKYTKYIPNLPTLSVFSTDGQPSSHSASAINPEDSFDIQLWEQIARANANHAARNEHIFGPLTDQNLVIVVQVHNRVNYLRTLINSMVKVRHIEETLVVFSHDFFDDQINKLVTGVNFTKVVQIFYPFSTQIWKQTFPGASPNDCPRDVNKEAALKLNCSNAKYPDSYGHYRESDVTQTKHHWWWKVNYLFDQHAATKGHNSDFIFLEEDHYLLPDFIHTWRLMRQSRRKLVEEESAVVDMLTLGNYEKNYNAKINADKVHLIEWFSSKHNMAFTIDRALFDKLKLCSSEVCMYDDYNWDWTLQHVILDCLDDNLLTLVSIVPRAFHIGSCGMHNKKSDCSTKAQVHKIEELYSNNQGKFFPDRLTVMRRQDKKPKIVNNGGWNDPRDHQLCLQYELPFENYSILAKNRCGYIPSEIIKSNANFAPFRKRIL